MTHSRLTAPSPNQKHPPALARLHSNLLSRLRQPAIILQLASNMKAPVLSALQLWQLHYTRRQPRHKSMTAAMTTGRRRHQATMQHARRNASSKGVLHGTAQVMQLKRLSNTRQPQTALLRLPHLLRPQLLGPCQATAWLLFQLPCQLLRQLLKQLLRPHLQTHLTMAYSTRHIHTPTHSTLVVPQLASSHWTVTTQLCLRVKPLIRQMQHQMRPHHLGWKKRMRRLTSAPKMMVLGGPLQRQRLSSRLWPA